MAGEEEEAPPAWLASLLTAQRHQTAQMITAAQGAAEGAAAGRISWMAQTTAAASVGSIPTEYLLRRGAAKMEAEEEEDRERKK